ncbi:hypothetical protein [Bacillus sp. SM2101]|nr:hypothetical protein [Bacillus sp. SM2101]
MSLAYVSNINSRDLSVIDTKTRSVIVTVRVDGFPQSIRRLIQLLLMF